MTTPQQQYENTCKDEFAEIKSLLSSINTKLFMGNGQPPLTVQIDRLNAFKKACCWFMGLMATVGIGLIARLVFVVLANAPS